MHKLGAFLCWAVVFADIGTSVYYVPGILFTQFKPYGHLAGFFVTLTMGAFVLLALKYAEVSVRFPEGGGVVTVSARALNPWMGALGGMFILVDYFLTAAISSLSGLQYFQQVFPPIGPFVLILTVIVLALLGVLNWWGIRESAMVSLYIAIAAFISDIVVIVAIFVTVPVKEIFSLFTSIFSGTHLTPVALVTGFAGAFLAFSGLESISQLSPVMQLPRSRTVTIALSIVVFTVGITSPLLTIMSTTLLDGNHNYLLAHPIAKIDPNQFISQLGAASAGPIIGIGTAVIASALLIFASNTAIIGTYHVFLALSRMSFFPRIVETRDKFRGTPIVSIALATGIPIAILFFANGQIDLLGRLYAFGLLGAFSLTSISLDALRVRERRGGKQITLHEEEEQAEAALRARGMDFGAAAPHAAASGYEDEDEDELGVSPGAPAAGAAHEPPAKPLQSAWRRYWPTVNFGLGFVTTALVLIAWATNLVTKVDATIFGGGLTVVGMAIAILHYNQRRQAGENVVQPSWAMSYSPNAVFAIAHTASPYNVEVVESAFRAARGRKVLLLFLSSRIPPTPRFMQINDPALRDDQAQDVFRLTQRLSQQMGAPAQVYYRIGGVASAAALWRVARAQEVVADKEMGGAFAESVAPTYIRYRRQGEAKIVHLIIRQREEPSGAVTPAPVPATPVRQAPPWPQSAASAAALYNEGAGLSDETWNEDDLRTLDDTYVSASGVRRLGPQPAHEEEASRFSEPPRPDHEHDGDTKPRHRLKIMQNVLPSQSGVMEAPRPAPLPAEPQPKTTTRMSEPTPLESDDDEWYYWNGEDLVRRDEHPTEGSSSGQPDPAKEG